MSHSCLATKDGVISMCHTCDMHMLLRWKACAGWPWFFFFFEPEKNCLENIYMHLAIPPRKSIIYSCSPLPPSPHTHTHTEKKCTTKYIRFYMHSRAYIHTLLYTMQLQCNIVRNSHTKLHPLSVIAHEVNK